MPAHRLRIIVACGAAGGIAATFNAPVTGLCFGFEIVLREFSLDALCMASLAAVAGDVISRAFFGSAPSFTAVPHDLLIRNDGSYLIVAVLAIAAGLIGVGFKTVLNAMEDRVGALWRGRPEWARPVVGGGGAGAAAARAAADVRRRLSGHGLGSVYTTKLLRRGIDIESPPDDGRDRRRRRERDRR
jgi:H+/Cl- antiporter ClcA